MWSWGAKGQGIEGSPVDDDVLQKITELDDFFPDEESDGEGSDYETMNDEFLMIQTGKEIRELQEQLESRIQSIKALESQNKTMANKFENATKLHSKETSFKDRLLQQKEAKILELGKQAQSTEVAYKQQTASINKNLQEVSDINQELNKTVAILKNEGHSLRCDIKKCKDDLRRAHASFEEAQKKHVAFVDAKTLEAAELKKSIASLEASIRKQTKLMQDQEVNAQNQKKQIAEQEESLRKQAVQLATTSQQVADLGVETKKLTADLEKARETHSTELNARDVDNQELQSKILSLENKLQQEESEKLQTKQELAKTKADVKKSEKLLAETHSELCDWKQKGEENMDLKRKVDTLSDTLRKERSKLKEEVHKVRDSCEARVEEFEKQIEQAEKEHQTKTQELNNKLAETCKHMWAASRKASEVKNEMESMKVQYMSAKEDTERLTIQMERNTQQFQQELQFKASKLTDAQDKIAALEKSLLAQERLTREQEMRADSALQQREVQLGKVDAESRQLATELATAKQQALNARSEAEEANAALVQLKVQGAADLSKQNAELNQCKAMVTKLEAANHQLEVTISQTKEELVRTKADSQTVSEQLSEMAEKVVEMDSQKEKCQELEEQLKREKQKARDEMTRLKGQYQGKLEELEKQMESENAANQAKSQQTNQKMTESSKKVWTLSRQNEELKAKNDDLEAQVLAQKEETKLMTMKTEYTNKNLNERLHTQELTAQGLKEVICRLEEKARSQERIINEKDAVVATLTGQLAEVTEQQNSQRAEMLSAQQTASELLPELEKAKQEMAESKQEMASRITCYEMKLQDANELISSLKAKLEDFHIKRDSSMAELEAQKDEYSMLQENARQMSAKNQELQTQVQELLVQQDQSKADLKSAVSEVTLQVEARELEITALRNEVQQSKLQAAEEVQQLKDQLEAKDQKIMRIQKEADAQREASSGSSTAALSKKGIRTSKGQQEVAKILRENPTCVPIRCIRSDTCSAKIPILEKKKFAVPKDMTLVRFSEHIRSKLGLPADVPIAITVDSEKTAPGPASKHSSTANLETLFQTCRQADGFLHLKYCDA